MRVGKRLGSVVLICVVVCAGGAQAATKTWTGVVDGQWSNAGNWAGGVPVAADKLSFFNAPGTHTTTNDLAAGIIFDDISFLDSPYSLAGNALGLTGGINNSSGSTNTITLPITLHATQSFVGSLNLGGNIALGANTLTLGNGSGFITVSGNISGSGGLTIGSSTVLSGANTYGGQTFLNSTSAFLTVNGTQPASPVLITTGSISGGGTIGSLTTNPSFFAQVAPSGILSSGPVALGSSTSFFTNLNGPVAGVDYGQLNVGGSVSIASGVQLQVGLSFAPSVGQTFTLVNNDGADAVSGTFNGLPEGAVLTINASQFQISYVGGTGNDIVLTCTVAAKTWSGAVNNLWSNPGNWGGVLPAAGDPLVFPPGAANLSNTNDLPAGTIYAQILMTGNGYTLGGNGLGLTGGINNNSGSPNTLTLPITLHATQSFVGSLNLGGNIALGANTLTLGNGSGFISVSGNISGSGGLTIGSSTVLSGANTYGGQTFLNSTSAFLTVNGTQPASPVLITTGSISGGGTIGSLTTNPSFFAQVAPSGILSSGPVALGSSTSFFTSLNGPAPGSGYGQLDVGGTISIASGVNFNAGLGFVPAQGQVFLVIDNDGTDAITGTFNGLPEGGTFSIGPYPFQVSYVGETGNDFTVTSLSGDPLNNAPIAQDDSYTAFSNTPLNVSAPGVLLNDSDPDLDTLTVLTTTASTTAGGSVTFSPNGAFIYTPPASYTGPDSFTYVISDGNNGTDIATVNITVLPAPTATDTGTPTETPTATPTATPDPSLCAATPASGCLAPLKSLFKLKDKNPAGPSAGDKLLWKWIKGPALLPGDFGNPATGGTALRLCVYDSGGLVTQLDVAAGGVCGANPCWKTTGSGFKFKDGTLAGDGVAIVSLKAGSAGKSKIIVKAKDGNLPLPALSLDDTSAVTVQLFRSDAALPCWEAVYAGPAVTNTTSQFKDKLP